MCMKRPETKMTALLLLLGISLGITGCISFYARQTFNGAILGQPWSKVSGAERYSMNGQLAFYSIDGPGDQEGTDYFIVVADNGKAIAKAYSIKGSPSAFGLQIQAKYWQELKEVGSHYPYYAEPVNGAGEFVPLYPPLFNPWSETDKVLPSGVRQSTWAGLTDFLSGWPFQTKYERWFIETKVYWKGTRRSWPEVVKSMERLPTEGTITVLWRKGPLSGYRLKGTGCFNQRK